MMVNRPRRLRRTPVVREMVAETRLSAAMLVYPCFVVAGTKIRKPVGAMPGVEHLSADELLRDAEALLRQGIDKVLLFGVGAEKSDDARSAYHDKGIIPSAVRQLKQAFGPQLYVMTDVCLCAYTPHGHCGVLEGGEVVNDATLPLLGKMAVAHAAAGADMVAPSDMMDGRVGAIRAALDEVGYSDTAILSYAVKFASAYYGPFREAADSAPASGDRRGYQMDSRNAREAVREALLDEAEGADVLMVKPALAYLDIIRSVKENTLLPVACYNVSGEYAMVKQAALAGLIDERQIVMENMYAFARAGADIILTYHARDMVGKGWLR